MPCRIPLDLWQAPETDAESCHTSPIFTQSIYPQASSAYTSALLAPAKLSRKHAAAFIHDHNTSFTGAAGNAGGDPNAPAPSGDAIASAEDEKTANLDIMHDAIHSAEGALHRSQRSMSDSRLLHIRLGDLKAERVTNSMRDALEKLIRESSGLQDKLNQINDEHGALEKTFRQHGDTRGFVKGLSDDLAEATATVDNMEKYIHRFYRRAWALTDIYNASSAQPTLEDTIPEPAKPDESEGPAAGDDEVIKTAAGCQCKKESKCAEHGREFKWCLVEKPDKKAGIKCPLYWDTTGNDAAGNDHRVAGAGVPSPMWDYCRLPEPNDPTDPNEPQQDPEVPAFAHRGCKCAFRGDMLGKAADNPAFIDKSGKFDWSRVPWSDRLGLEAMVVHYLRNSLAQDPAGGVGAAEHNEEHICVRTPSSGSLHVCPAINANENLGPLAQHLGDPGWCGNHTWDFCVPSEPKDPAADAAQTVDAGTPGADPEEVDTSSAEEKAAAAAEMEAELQDPNAAAMDPILALIAPIARFASRRRSGPSQLRASKRVGLAFL